MSADGIPAAALREAAEKIKGAKADLMAMCTANFLSKNSSKEMTKYLESFFQNIDNLPIEPKKAKGNLR